MPVCLPELGVELPYDNTLTRAGSQIWSTLMFSMGCLCMPETVFSSCWASCWSALLCAIVIPSCF